MPAVAFDLLGTLFSLDMVLAALSRIIENDTGQRQARRLLQAWMTAATRDYMATSHAGEYRTLEHVLETTLPRACALEDFPMPTTATVHDIMTSFQELRPRPNAIETIQSLYRAGWDLWIMTSGSYDDAHELLSHHGLLDYFCLPNQDKANIYGCDELRISRPHPKVYSELMRLNVRRTRRIENFYYVSAHAWDIAGAKNLSYRTIFLSNEEMLFPSDLYQRSPDAVRTDLLDAMQAMIAIESHQEVLKTRHCFPQAKESKAREDADSQPRRGEKQNIQE
ncbi:HAD-like domain-containing protein [Syncephalastrum racemosum]|uniref:HAD-like domain-containing protein n=1 Tax=Syncephalastrum racemosum TaxID=13706 RepID=A0A1X2HJZ0_SYNRA|nr:HAD-like domain-containing protein [Syncephalastrum racemosum]